MASQRVIDSSLALAAYTCATETPSITAFADSPDVERLQQDDERCADLVRVNSIWLDGFDTPNRCAGRMVPTPRET